MQTSGVFKRLAGAATLAVLLYTTAVRADPIPLEGTWVVDPAHTSINFSVQHMVISRVHGHFNDFAGTIVAARDITKSSVEFTIQVASIDTGVAARDNHLRSAAFFDAATYPQITFKSMSIKRKGGNNYSAHGMFTMHGVSKVIELPFQLNGPINVKGYRIGVTSKLTINRQEWGLTYNQALETGGLAVGNDIDIDISLEAVPPKA